MLFVILYSRIHWQERKNIPSSVPNNLLGPHNLPWNCIRRNSANEKNDKSKKDEKNENKEKSKKYEKNENNERSKNSVEGEMIK